MLLIIGHDLYKRFFGKKDISTNEDKKEKYISSCCPM